MDILTDDSRPDPAVVRHSQLLGHHLKSDLPPVHFASNEAAFSLALVPFAERRGELHLVIGMARDTFLAPRTCTTGLLKTYRVTDDGRSLEFLHEVSVFAHIHLYENAESSL